MDKRILCWLLTFTMVFSMFGGIGQVAFGESFMDVDNHWAKADIEMWTEKDLISGYGDGTFKPNDNITRAEFIKLVNNVINIQNEEEISFSDVDESDWYYKDLKRAIYGEYITGYEDNTFRANGKITRQEVAVILQNIAQLQETEEDSLGKFTDTEDTPAWSRASLMLAVQKGYLSGYEDNTLKASNYITRAESVKVLNNLFGIIYNESGVYGPSVDKESLAVSGNVTVSVEDVTLQNMIIDGDLYLAEGIGEGDVTLDNITVTGETIVKGGGENSIIIRNSSLANLLIIKKDSKIRIIAQGNTTINKTYIYSSARLQVDRLNANSFGEVEVIRVTARENVEFEGSFEKIDVKTPAFIEITGNSKIEELNIHKDLGNVNILVSADSRVEKLYAHSEIEVVNKGIILEALGDFAKDSSYDVRLPVNLQPKTRSGTSTPAAAKYNLALNVTPTGSGKTSGAGSYEEGTRVTITATANDGYEFVEWKDGEDKITTSSAFSYTTTSGNKTFTAYFEPTSQPKYSLSLGLDPVGSGTTSGAGSYEEGTKVTITATAEDGYEFVEWKDGENQITTSSAFNYTVTSENKILTAYFESTGEFAGGSGTEGDPYKVATAEQLNKVRNYLNGHFIQIANIDLGASPWNEGEGWEPIGSTSTPFTGFYDGYGYKIQNLFIDRPLEDNIGLFGVTNGTIQRVEITNVSVEGKEYTGSLAGINSGVISQCYSSGSVKGQENVGGLVGASPGSGALIQQSFSMSIVQGNSNVGGLAGMTYGLVTESYATGSVTGDYRAGGLIGACWMSVTNSYAAGKVTGTTEPGGLIGAGGYGLSGVYYDQDTTEKSDTGKGVPKSTIEMIDKSTFTEWDFDSIWTIRNGESYPYLQWQGSENIHYPPNPFAGGTGTVSDPYQVETAEHLNNVRKYLDAHFIQTADIDLTDYVSTGGDYYNDGKGWEPIGSLSTPFIGSYDGDGKTISDLFINRSPGTYVGLFGYTSAASSLENITLTSIDVLGVTYTGGLVGYNAGDVIACSARGTVEGISSTTGLLAGLNKGTIEGSIAKGEVDGINAVGGFVGSNETGGAIIGSYAEVIVNATGYYIGGFVGSNLTTTQIDDCFSSGDVKGSTRVGGFVGLNYGTLNRSFSSCNVTASPGDAQTFSGGLVGYNYGSIVNCYSLGDVSGYSYVGGLAGANTSAGTNYGNISNSYSIGSVSATEIYGGLLGFKAKSSIVTSSYWDTEASGISISAGGTGYTTSAMIKSTNSVPIYEGWDFDTIWNIVEGSTYPYLRDNEQIPHPQPPRG